MFKKTFCIQTTRAFIESLKKLNVYRGVSVFFLLSIVTIANAQNQVRIIAEETYKRYKMEMYSDETSKIFDENGNWVHFYTEYETDEYSGEITNNPVKLQSFILDDGEAKFWADIFEANIIDKNGYCLQMGNGHITIKAPNGCVLCINNFSIIHDPYPFKNKEPDQIKKEIEFSRKNGINRNGYIPRIIIKTFVYKDIESKLYDFTNTKEVLNTNYYVIGPDGKKLKQIRDKEIRIFPSKPSQMWYTKIDEGYYDESSHKIYDLHGSTYLQLCSYRTGGEGSYSVEDTTVAVTCLPSDTITKFIYTGKTAEIHYSNGDYLKYSYLKGIIYDCLMHRSDGIFSIKIEDNEPIARFEYTSGIFAGYTYHEDDQYDIKEIYQPDKILGRNNFVKPRTHDDFYETNTNKKLDYREGSLFDYETNKYVVLGEQKKQELEKEKKEKQEMQAKLQPLYKKYGKKYVDALFYEGKILVGTPEDLIKNNTQCTLVSETQYTRTYKIAGTFNDWAATVDVSVQTKKVTSVTNWTF